MSHRIGLATAVWVLALCMGAMAQEGQKVELRQYALPDSYLRCTAWTLVAPADWVKEGGVVWTGRALLGRAYSTELSIHDTAREFRLFPTFMFVETRGAVIAPGAEIAPVLSPVECVEKIILKRCRPEATGVRVVWSDVLPQLTKEAVALAKASGLESIDPLRVRSSRVLVEYTAGGREMEEMVYCTVVDAPGAENVRVWANERTFSYRAQKGKLKDSMALLGTIGRSLKENPRWIALRRERVQQLAAADVLPPRMPGWMGIVDVSPKAAREQDEFLKGVDGSAAAEDWAIPAAGKLGADDTDIGSGYLRYYRGYSRQVHRTGLGESDPYTSYPTSATQPQSR